MLFLLLILPLDLPIVDHVDSCEYNHFYDEKGMLVFDQLIFRNWNKRECRFDIVDWRLLKDGKLDTKSYIWHDGQILRVVKFLTFTETWTQYDPELVERSILPKELRIGFSNAVHKRRVQSEP